MTDDEIEALHKRFEVGDKESPNWGFAWHDFAREVERHAIAAERERVIDAVQHLDYGRWSKTEIRDCLQLFAPVER